MKKKSIVVVLMVFLMVALFTIKANAQEAQTYVVQEGSFYYESSWDFGSGKYGVVEQENQYTDIPCEVTINGYAFLNAEGNILKAFANPQLAQSIAIPEAPEGTVATWIHFNGAIYRNGWTDYANVELTESTANRYAKEMIGQLEEQQTPEEVADQINQITQSGDTVVVVDVSGSMYESQEKVIQKLDDFTFDEKTTFVVFADYCQQVSYEELKNGNYAVGNYTNMFGALNYVAQMNPNNIILMSDLGDSEGETLKTMDFSGNIVIYNPASEAYGSELLDYLHRQTRDIIGAAWKNVSSKIFVIK